MAHGECNHSIRGKIRLAKTAYLVATILFLFAVSSDARIVHGFTDIFAIDTVTAIGDGHHAPEATVLTAIYPNPFNPRTTIDFEVAEAGMLGLSVYDLQGRLVTVLAQGHRSPGVYRAAWDGCDATGREVPAGLYFCRLVVGQDVQTMKMILTK